MPWRPSQEWIKARKAEIARRYRRKPKDQLGKPRTIAAIRIAELARLYEHRYGGRYLPETDSALTLVRIMAHHLGALPNADRRIQAWVMTCASWLPIPEMERLISEVTYCRLRWRAKTLGWKLHLTDRERTALRIRTIAPIDVTPAEMNARRKQQQRIANTKYRRRKGAKLRAEYLRETQGKPWLALGVSRATYYRKRKTP